MFPFCWSRCLLPYLNKNFSLVFPATAQFPPQGGVKRWMNWHNLYQKLALNSFLKASGADKLLHFLSWEFAHDSRKKEEKLSSIVQFNSKILNCAPVVLNLLCFWWRRKKKEIQVKSKSFQFNFILRKKLSTFSPYLSCFQTYSFVDEVIKGEVNSLKI